MPSGNSLDLGAIQLTLGPIKSIAMHPDFFKKLCMAAEIINHESPDMYKGHPIKITELVDDWWPMFESDPNPLSRPFTREIK